MHVAYAPQPCWPASTGVKSATALSQAVIAGGAIAGVAVTLHKRHPHDPNASLIDFDLALMLLPVLLIGVSLGEPASPPTLLYTAVSWGFGVCISCRKLVLGA